MKRSGPIRRRSRLQPRSAATTDARSEREALCARVAAAYGHRCALHTPGECRGAAGYVWRVGDPLDFHEVVRRSQWPGAHLDERFVIPLCRHHHNLDLRLSVAEQVGIRAPRWAYDRLGVDVVLAELSQRRAAYRAGDTLGPPSWRTL